MPAYRCTQVLLRTKILYFTAAITLISIIFRAHRQYNYSWYKNITTSFRCDESDIGEEEKKIPQMKYILLWTNRDNFPFVYFGEGSSIFVNKKCEWTNCYVTGDRNFLGDYTEFEVVAFNGPQLESNLDDLPERRSDHQKYVFANIESSANYPVCSKLWNGFFNWTWTYKLNSDAIWGYIVIKNASNHVIGPRENIHWMNIEEMDPIGQDLKAKLQSKKLAAAWFASNCKTLNYREEYVKNIKYHLNRYHLDVDIYGDCGTMQCPKEVMGRCLKLLERNYYFYFAFENTASEDYVTEKILYALNHNTVPVVFGGANYSRFMPPETYLNALELGPEKLAQKMFDIIQNSTMYYRFFKWKKYYSFHLRHESPSTDDYCHFCAMINDETLMKTTTVYENFDVWWKNVTNCQTIRGGYSLVETSFQR